MLADRFNRTISYLRISVTERCNFRCVYCMLAEGIALAHRDDLLSFEEIVRVVHNSAGIFNYAVREKTQNLFSKKI